MKYEFNDYDLMQLVLRVTGQLYTFAVADGAFCGFKGVDTVYQLMPHTDDDGFFDWYCLERVDDQFFETKQDCALNFLKYWHIWKGQWHNANIKYI